MRVTERGVQGLSKPGEKMDETNEIFRKVEWAVSAVTDLDWSSALLQNRIHLTPTQDDRISGK